MPSLTDLKPQHVECSLRRSACALTPVSSALPTPPPSSFRQQSRPRSSKSACRLDGVSVHISSLIYPYCTVQRHRIETMLLCADLPIGTVAASCCILRSLSRKFYNNLRLLVNGTVIGELVLISAFMIASKYMEDETWHLKTWASICDADISLSDLRVTELQVLKSIDYNVTTVLTNEAIDEAMSEFASRQCYIDFFCSAASNYNDAVEEEEEVRQSHLGRKRRLSAFLETISGSKLSMNTGIEVAAI